MKTHRHKMIKQTLRTWRKGSERGLRLQIVFSVHCLGDGCTKISQIATKKKLIHVNKYHLYPNTPIIYGKIKNNFLKKRHIIV